MRLPKFFQGSPVGCCHGPELNVYISLNIQKNSECDKKRTEVPIRLPEKLYSEILNVLIRDSAF